METTFGEKGQLKTITVKYLVVNARSAYNLLLGGPTLNRIGVVISTSHLKVKYPLDDGVLIGTITANQELAHKCHKESLKNQRKWYGDQTGHQVNVLNLNPRKDFEEWRQTSTKDVKEKAMAERKVVKLGTTLPLEIETELILTLKEKHRGLHMEFSRYV